MTHEILLANGTRVRFNKFKEIIPFLRKVAYLRETEGKLEDIEK